MNCICICIVAILPGRDFWCQHWLDTSQQDQPREYVIALTTSNHVCLQSQKPCDVQMSDTKWCQAQRESPRLLSLGEFNSMTPTIRVTCSIKLTGSQRSLSHGMNKKLKWETKNKPMSVQSHYHEGSPLPICRNGSWVCMLCWKYS